MSRNEHKLGSWEQENAEDDDDNDCDSDVEGSTYGDSGISAPRDLRQPQAHVTVTDADLRAMALYRFEKGDGSEIRRYGLAAWREFAQRLEVSIFLGLLDPLVSIGMSTEPYRSLEPSQAKFERLDLHPAKAYACSECVQVNPLLTRSVD